MEVSDQLHDPSALPPGKELSVPNKYALRSGDAWFISRLRYCLSSEF